MKDQHTMIRGYRDLSQAEIDTMNRLKEVAGLVGEECLKLREQLQAMPTETPEQCAEFNEALRWVDAGELQAQQAFMSLIRSVARPTTF